MPRFRTLIIIVLLVEAVLLAARFTGAAVPGPVLLIPAALLAGYLVALGIGTLRRSRRAGIAPAIGEVAGASGIPRRALAYLIHEVLMLRGLISRRPRPAPGRELFGYHGPLTPVVVMVLVLSIIEITVVHLALPPGVVRVVILVLSIYAVVVLLGFLRSMQVHPHEVAGRVLTIRGGALTRARIPLAGVTGIRRCRPGSGGGVDIGSGCARIPVLGQVNVRVELAEPAELHHGPTGVHRVDAVEFHVDDPDRLIAACRR